MVFSSNRETYNEGKLQQRDFTVGILLNDQWRFTRISIKGSS